MRIIEIDAETNGVAASSPWFLQYIAINKKDPPVLYCMDLYIDTVQDTISILPALP
jgi:hypothetical protein